MNSQEFLKGLKKIVPFLMNEQDDPDFSNGQAGYFSGIYLYLKELNDKGDYSKIIDLFSHIERGITNGDHQLNNHIIFSVMFDLCELTEVERFMPKNMKLLNKNMIEYKNTHGLHKIR